jgi:acetate kinase
MRIDEAMLVTLKRFIPLAPLHQPHNLEGVAAARRAFPKAAEVGCFDTAFHRTHSSVADTYALPRRFYDEGVRRYGFHGLAYESISRRLAETAPSIAAGRVIALHLGNGASACAMREGRAVDSTLGFTALDGLPMGSRCGQIDPGVLLYLMTEKGMTAEAISGLLYNESGLKGLSGLSNDMRTLEASDDPAARGAIEYFVARLKREIGGLAAMLGGVDALVFTGGIGEHSSRLREAVLTGCEWLGVTLDGKANQRHAGIISAASSRVTVFVLAVDEERIIAEHAARLAGFGG